MAEEMENCKLSLDTSKKDLLCDVITMKAPNFFTLPEYGSHCEIRSPSFEFQNASWCFILRSLKSRKDGARIFNVCMKRISSRVSQQRVFYKITLLDANDSWADMHKTDEDGKMVIMGKFNNRKSLFDRCDTLTLIIHLPQFNESTTDTAKILQIQDLQDAETEKRNDCKVSLKFSKKFITCNVYTLKLSNALQRISTEFEWKSTSFEFGNETWCFQVYSKDPNTEDGYLNVYLSRLSSEKKYNKKIDEELTFLETVQLNDEKTMDFSTYYVDEGKNVYDLCYVPIRDINNAALDRVSLIFCLFPMKSFEVDAANMSFTITRDLDLLSDDLKELFANKETCDTTLCVQGIGVSKEYKVHRAILIARSTVFAAMFQHDTKEKQTGIVEIVDCEPETFKHFLEYLYCGKLDEISFNIAFHLYNTADKYNTMKLKTFCVQYLMHCLTTENICDIFILADNYNDDELFAAGQDFFNRNLNQILKTSKWRNLIKDNFCLTNRILIEMSTKMKVID